MSLGAEGGRVALVLIRALSGVVLVAVLACPSPSTTECERNNQCEPPLECRLGYCREPVTDAGSTCAAGNNCAAGEACSTGAQCASGSCAGGVCCAQACNGACATCAKPNALGQCLPRGEGQPCGAGLCDGKSVACDLKCASSAECAATAVCCPTSKTGYDACNKSGLAGQCAELPPCSRIVDAFDGASIDPLKWTVNSNGKGTARLERGQLVVSSGSVRDAGPTLSVSFLSVEHCSMVNSSVSVELVETSALKGLGPFSISELRVNADDRSLGQYGIAAFDSDLKARQINTPDGGKFFSRDNFVYQPAEQRFLRLRATTGEMFFEYSADGRQYAVLERMPALIPLNDVRAGVGLFLEKPQVRPDGGTMGEVIFDRFNTGP
jgi:hypothetical protein